MLLNPYLFEELYIYNLKHNLDMIEFSVFHKKEEGKKIYNPNFHEFNHYHNFEETIIYQPKLSYILFYIPNTKYYTSIFCRTIWNKLIRKNIKLIIKRREKGMAQNIQIIYQKQLYFQILIIKRKEFL